MQTFWKGERRLEEVERKRNVYWGPIQSCHEAGCLLCQSVILNGCLAPQLIPTIPKSKSYRFRTLSASLKVVFVAHDIVKTRSIVKIDFCCFSQRQKLFQVLQYPVNREQTIFEFFVWSWNWIWQNTDNLNQ